MRSIGVAEVSLTSRLRVLMASRAWRRRLWVLIAVVASWVLAVGVLLTLIRLLGVTPGDFPDHLE